MEMVIMQTNKQVYQVLQYDTTRLLGYSSFISKRLQESCFSHGVACLDLVSASFWRGTDL
jgi:hypothetical protein